MPATNTDSFDRSDFITALISALILRQTVQISLENPKDKMGIRRMKDALDQAVENCRESRIGNEAWFRSLVRLRNVFVPGEQNYHERLERALRNLQSSYVEHPNPDYKYIRFQISPPNAQGIVDSLPTNQRKIVDEVADAFLESSAS